MDSSERLKTSTVVPHQSDSAGAYQFLRGLLQEKGRGHLVYDLPNDNLPQRVIVHSGSSFLIVHSGNSFKVDQAPSNTERCIMVLSGLKTPTLAEYHIPVNQQVVRELLVFYRDGRVGITGEGSMRYHSQLSLNFEVSSVNEESQRLHLWKVPSAPDHRSFLRSYFNSIEEFINPKL